MLANKQHTITILNQGEEFVVEHLEVTVDDTTSSSTEPKSSQVVAINPTAISTSSSQISTTTSAPSTTLSSSLSDTTVFSTTSSTIASDTTLTSSTTTPLSETSDTSVTQSQSIHPVSATISSTNIPTNEPETTEIAKNHSPTLTMGATIGVAAAGSFLLLLFLLAAAWWLYRKRIGGKRIDPSLSDDPQQLPPRTFATAGREHVPAIVPVARHRKGPSVYVSVGSSDDLFVGGSQDAFGHVPSSIIYPNEKNGPGIVPLYSPSSATSLLQQRSAYAYPTSTAHVLLGTPATVHRKDQSFVRRRSQDGGVRIAGGPPGHQSEDPGDTFLDMDSRRNTSYTLPPEYNFDSPAF
ncbi:hypothetical protein BD310DRAFT_950452 [Dichomitus squalens]|uniref:Uncharacterized protein n=1 Tax=Dichomitus squalens TaxID=114155 RepID=A0A4Q9PNS5_9APHY|nr:hypothetical protein BD310DRAFT_950452 [Dichomitus squalens]